ncbi:DUF624 domain-containing protein [Clostridium sp. SYSU_GA19001]|uniref:YesL family protein n=1 Tax=Clostridium caldaquaticum TaxID=2940653 RepID=UPI002077375B|nr:DUF624 domain-containing protein [Clostridium caldaquaticum]MCM8709642.1 DUF624 domain-containing protein [Clostridium caldaquaticum]
MSKKREFGEGPIYTITNYIMWFFLGNFYFMVCNIPFLFILLGFNGTFTMEYAVLLILSSLPIGPAYTALLSAMGKLVREKDVNITRDYFKAYKINFLQSLFLWTLQIVIITILFVDIRFFAVNAFGKFIIPIFYGLILIVIFTGIYVFPIISRFYLKTKDILKVSFFYMFSKIKVTLTCASIFVIAYFILIKITSTAVLFIMSVLCFSIMYIQKDLLRELQIKVSPESIENETITE